MDFTLVVWNNNINIEFKSTYPFIIDCIMILNLIVLCFPFLFKYSMYFLLYCIFLSNGTVLLYTKGDNLMWLHQTTVQWGNRDYSVFFQFLPRHIRGIICR